MNKIDIFMTSLLVFRDTITQSPFFNEISLAIHTHTMMNTALNFLFNSHKNEEVVIQKCQVRTLAKPNGILMF